MHTIDIMDTRTSHQLACLLVRMLATLFFFIIGWGVGYRKRFAPHPSYVERGYRRWMDVAHSILEWDVLGGWRIAGGALAGPE